VAEWIDLLDPSANEVRDAIGVELPDVLVEQLGSPPDERRRPRLTGGDGWVAGVLLVPVLVELEDRLYHQEIGLVVTRERAVTVRKTPPVGEPFDPEAVREFCSTLESPPAGLIAYHLLDDVAERYLDLEDGLNAEIDELEDHIDDWAPDRIRRRITDIRRDVLDIRRSLSPTRDAVRRVVDGRLDTGEERVADEAMRPLLGEAYDKLLRASEGLDFSRDLLTAAREYHQSRIGQEQNDVIKKLTVIASLLLLPTFIVGVYGQNFDHMPELHWQLGYAFSWAVILGSTLVQLTFFRWRRWI
jgi:magnesium transporter